MLVDIWARTVTPVAKFSQHWSVCSTQRGREGNAGEKKTKLGQQNQEEGHGTGGDLKWFSFSSVPLILLLQTKGQMLNLGGQKVVECWTDLEKWDWKNSFPFRERSFLWQQQQKKSILQKKTFSPHSTPPLSSIPSSQRNHKVKGRGWGDGFKSPHSFLWFCFVSFGDLVFVFNRHNC